ncbi:hypothetical protein O6H91_13G031500 [Diphasiastrum complanatum]|uniref:Uncharacterized protein n=1 Tax=Diphasiastrum complanatum TaxID=34168 RepID=A0ACC2BTE7_DIPCM|nr:hypothetical protein O6H91_13G031500 [Diphasiastrum complanatum]
MAMAPGIASCYCMHTQLLVFYNDAGIYRPGRSAISQISSPSKTSQQICSNKAGRGVVVRAASQVEATPTKDTVPDTEVSITKTSFGTIGLALGSSLLTYGFGAYFTILPGAEWSALMLTYGFPLAIIGMALKYAELKPVPCITYADAFSLRKSQATAILDQVRNDVTRYRYGDEQHLEEALKRIFRYGQAGGIQRRNAPTLQSIREEEVVCHRICMIMSSQEVVFYVIASAQILELHDYVNQHGKYALVLVFEAKALKLKDFEERQAKFTSFFGPGVTAEIAAREENIYEVWLVADGGPQASVTS